MDKVLLVIGDAAEVFDTLYPIHRVREDGYELVIAAPEVRTYHLVQHDTHPDWDITIESKGYNLDSDIAFRDIDPEEYSGIIISGGRAPEYLRYDADLNRVVKAMYDAGKPVGSVCHGIEIVVSAGIIEGKTATTVAKCQLDIEYSGGKYVNQEVVVDGNLITARTWHDNWIWMREYMRALNAYRETHK